MQMCSAEPHIGEDLAVNQCWDVRSDCILWFLASSALERNWIDVEVDLNELSSCVIKQ